MGENFAVGDGSGNWFPVFVDQDGGDADHVGTCATGIDASNSVTDGTGDAVGIEGAPFCGSLGKVAGDHSDGVVTAFAVARKFNSFAVVEQADVAQVPGRTVGVGVGGLTPLMLGFLMAAAAVLCCGKGLGVNEFTGVGGHQRGEEMSLVAEPIVVFFRHLYAVGGSSGGSFVGFATGCDGAERQRGCQGEREVQDAHDNC